MVRNVPAFTAVLSMALATIVALLALLAAGKQVVTVAWVLLACSYMQAPLSVVLQASRLAEMPNGHRLEIGCWIPSWRCLLYNLFIYIVTGLHDDIRYLQCSKPPSLAFH